MKQEYVIEIAADNNFSVLNRIINILNRRRVRIKRLVALENETDFRRGGVLMLVYTTQDLVEKVKVQLEKLIEVDAVSYYEGTITQVEIADRYLNIQKTETINQ